MNRPFAVERRCRAICVTGRIAAERDATASAPTARQLAAQSRQGALAQTHAAGILSSRNRWEAMVPISSSFSLSRRSFVFEPHRGLLRASVWIAPVGTLFFITTISGTGNYADRGSFIELALAVSGILALIYLAASWILVPATKRMAFKERKGVADHLIKNIGQNSDVNFCLYLRPYFSDYCFGLQSSRFSLNSLAFGRWLSFEDAVAQAIDCKCSVVTLGGNRGKDGPAEIVVPDRDWQDAVTTLMEHASLIVVIPFSQPATRWEVKQVFRKSMLDKTVFIVPPLTDNYVVLNAAMFNEDKIPWDVYEYSHKVFSLEGFQLPKFRGDGGMFWYDKVLDEWAMHPFSGVMDCTPQNLRRLIFEVRNIPSVPNFVRLLPKRRLTVVK